MTTRWNGALGAGNPGGPAQPYHARLGASPIAQIARFIWDANPSYDVYQEFTKRHFQLAIRFAISKGSCSATALLFVSAGSVIVYLRPTVHGIPVPGLARATP
jgi:hypothetical protein